MPIHWTQRPENRAKLRQVGFKGAKTRRENSTKRFAPIPQSEPDTNTNDLIRQALVGVVRDFINQKHEKAALAILNMIEDL